MYNVVVIVKTGPKGQKTKEKVEKAIAKEAKVVKVNDIGEQEFSYPINKEERGYYFWIDFMVAKDKLSQVESKIRQEEPLRCLITIKPEEEPEKEQPAKRRKPKSKDKAEKKKMVGKTKKQTKKEAKKTTEKKPKKMAKKKTISAEKRMKDLDKKLEEIL